MRRGDYRGILLHIYDSHVSSTLVARTTAANPASDIRSKAPATVHCDTIEKTRMNIFRLVLVPIAGSLILGCTSIGQRGPVSEPEFQELMSGEVLFGERIDTTDIPDPGLFALDDDMRAFVADNVGDANAERSRMRRLLSAMIESGLMSLDYDDAKTKTARETFHDRVGNCMSFTSLFVALGREADLDVSFQVVDVPPVWYSDSNLIILNNHVNALVRQKFGSRVVVDFNVTDLKGDYPTREVSDDYALALYFNNIAMDALRAGKSRESFRLLKKSIETYPRIVDTWTNLGVVYARNKKYEHAIRAYSLALKIDNTHRPSLKNLAAVYRNMGDSETADFYARRVNRYQQQNPYYHYYTALAAYNNDELDTALERLKPAFRLHRRDHKFYQLRGLIYVRQGDTESALSNFTRARELAAFGDAKSILDRKIALLDSPQSSKTSIR